MVWFFDLLEKFKSLSVLKIFKQIYIGLLQI